MWEAVFTFQVLTCFSSSVQATSFLLQLPLVLHHMDFLPITVQLYLRIGCTFLSYMQ